MNEQEIKLSELRLGPQLWTDIESKLDIQIHTLIIEQRSSIDTLIEEINYKTLREPLSGLRKLALKWSLERA